jgi:hypothetical protein
MPVMHGIDGHLKPEMVMQKTIQGRFKAIAIIIGCAEAWLDPRRPCPASQPRPFSMR